MIDTKWVFMQYTAGAGGKLFCCCLQTAKSVASWSENLLDPIALATHPKEDVSIIRCEPDHDYRLPWLSRSFGIERGYDLSKDTVNELVADDELLTSRIQNGERILVSCTHDKLPNWFKGTLIQIVNDDESIDWLMARRRRLFYYTTQQGIIETRYDARFNTKPERDDRCITHTPLDILVSEQIRKETFYIEPDSVHINLSWLVKGQIDLILKTMEDGIEDNLDRDWCERYLRAWLDKNNRYYI